MEKRVFDVCPTCGEPTKEGANFCEKCNTKICVECLCPFKDGARWNCGHPDCTVVMDRRTEYAKKAIRESRLRQKEAERNRNAHL